MVLTIFIKVNDKLYDKNIIVKCCSKQRIGITKCKKNCGRLCKITTKNILSVN